MSKFFTIFETATGAVIETICLDTAVFADPSTIAANADGEDVAAYGPWDAATMSFAEVAPGADPASQDFDGVTWTASPAKARDRRWADAKGYYEVRSSAGFALDGIGTVQTDAKSREAIRMLADEARDRLADGDVDWSTSFINEANEAVPVTAPQIIAIYAGVRGFLGECYSVCQGHREALDAAVASGASADEIAAIDVTTGYPA